MAAPRTTHHSAVLHILRYVKGTLLHGLHFSASSSLSLSGYSDADWAGDPTGLKQTLVSRLSAESEYRALADSTAELLWLRRLLVDLGVPQSSSTALYCDSQSAVKILDSSHFSRDTVRHRSKPRLSWPVSPLDPHHHSAARAWSLAGTWGATTCGRMRARAGGTRDVAGLDTGRGRGLVKTREIVSDDRGRECGMSALASAGLRDTHEVAG
ncbi:cysteine-rich RLK (RECEPTOR-like protein kinase) 8 [Striga hermonthica]|uniref:Cysteine-rich RLK (RECEPTOR-like protein kinase) 8 n=1 Tax=Striga hermonthica TaxID=68872 RepID=A0A9N7NM45_STRHE|nr:cysteine-rich RLK (RECEPTOR-like protein kinase) 8 [Striga hermonthica]